MGPPPGADHEIDAGGQTILPGFVDAHVHIMFELGSFMQRLNDPFSLRFYRAAQYMRQTLDAGVTTVRDCGGADLGIKRAIELGLVAGPRLQICVTVLGITGGHSDGWLPSGIDIGLFDGYPGNPSGICDGVEEVRKKVREVLRAGAEIIKICSTGGVFSPTDHPEFTQFSPEELRVIVQEAAYRRGVKVMSHAQGLDGVRNAVEAGIHSIEHGIYLDDAVMELMIERGTYVVPTLLAPIGVLGSGGSGARRCTGIRRPQSARSHRSTPREHRARPRGRRAHRDGHRLRRNAARHEFARAAPALRRRLHADEAIVASTRIAAECLGWEADIGTLAVGKLADVVICQGDPLADITTLEDTTNIALVMQGGRVLKDTRAA